MKAWIPSAGTPVRLKDLWCGDLGMFRRDAVDRFEEALRGFTRTRWGRLLCSGTAAFYAILLGLRKLSSKDEVVLPAYTAPCLYLPIQETGLKLRLCDISLDTFNLDPERLPEAVTDRTLCIVPVHMFGLISPMDAINEVAKSRGCCVVEDAASALGARYKGAPAGDLGDIGFTSFNRGKNLSTATGGFWSSNDEAIAGAVEEATQSLPRPGLGRAVALKARSVALWLAVKPWLYNLFRRGVLTLRYVEVHETFDAMQYTRFQAGAGAATFRRRDDIFEARHRRGMFLLEKLGRLAGVRLPKILEGSRPVFNQFPLLLDQAEWRDHLRRALHAIRLETTILYDRPIHEIYDVAPGPGDPFPQATALSRRLLLIPCHPGVPMSRLEEAVGVIQKTVRDLG